jgi:hypothetical protein
MVKDGSYGAPAATITDHFFTGPLTLYRRPTEDLHEVLPPLYEPVRVTVIYVTPHGRIEFFGFVFERPMLEMIKMRGATNGRCTDLFGDSNIHVDLGPLMLGPNRLCLGIGHDKGIEVTSMGHKMFLSMLDITHSVHCKERFVKLRDHATIRRG